MVLIQILITPGGSSLTTANKRFQVISVTGKCSIRVLNMVYADSAAATTHRTIQVVSDNLYFPYSPLRYLTLISNPTAALNYDVSFKEYQLKDQVLNGQLLLQVVDKATGAEPDGFVSCLISLDVEQVDKEYQ